MLDTIPQALTNPDTKDPFHKTMGPKWGKIRTVLSGTQAMRDAGEKYTPKFEQEDDKTYKRRLAKTDLTNVLADSIENAVAKPFAEPVKLDKDNSLEEYLKYEKDIDLQGNDLNSFAEDSFYQAISDGVGYLLAGTPDIGDQQLTVKDEQDQNIRPYIVYVDAPAMLSYRRSVVNGATVPTYIRYISETIEFDAESQAITVKTVHEIQAKVNGTPGYFRTYESRSGGTDSQAWEVKSKGAYNFDQVTVVQINFGKKHERNKDNITPPFLDLAETNIAHWNSQSDQNNILECSRFAMFHFINMEEPRDGEGNPQKIYFGPGSYFYSPPAGTGDTPRIEAVSLPIEGLEQGWKDLDRKEASMKAMGLDPVTSKDSGALTASERIIEEKSSNSKLANWSLRFAHNLELAFSYMGLWAGLENASEIKIIINTEFGVTEKEISEIKILQDMHARGQLSLETLLNETKRRQVFDVNFNTKKELDQILYEQDDTNSDQYEPPSGGASPPPKGDVKLPKFPQAA